MGSVVAIDNNYACGNIRHIHRHAANTNLTANACIATNVASRPTAAPPPPLEALATRGTLCR